MSERISLDRARPVARHNGAGLKSCAGRDALRVRLTFSALASPPDDLVAFGYTNASRRLAVVYEEIDSITVYPVTAYEID